MSYGNLINNTFRIAGKYWWLWLFGIFLSLGDAGGGLGQLSGRFEPEDFSWTSTEWLPAIAFGILVFAGFAALVFLVCKILAECSLIMAVKDITKGGRGAISSSFRRGLPHFWRILGLWVLELLLILTAIFICGGGILIGFLLTPILGVLALLIMLPLWFAITFVVSVVAAWAYRAATIDNRPVSDAIAVGWQLLRQNMGQSIVVGLIAIGSQIAFGLVGMMIYAFVGVPFIIAGHINLWLGLIPGLIVGFFVMAIIEGFTGTYASTLWTLAYLDLKQPNGAAAESVVAGGDAA